jgi:4-carboxymuconolactone decarboxylase
LTWPARRGDGDISTPPDIDPQSGCRLPLPRRDDLDDAGKRVYDRASAPGESLAGLSGPAGVLLHSPGGLHLLALNRYLRFESGIAPRLREVAILTTLREMQSQFQWAAHEPEALRVGVPAETIAAIKHRRSTKGLDETDALVIELGRQIWRGHKVSAQTFASATERFGGRMVVDLVLLMGAYSATAALLAAVDMQLRPGDTPPLATP